MLSAIGSLVDAQLFRPPRRDPAGGGWVPGAQVGTLLTHADAQAHGTELSAMLSKKTGLPCVCALPSSGEARYYVVYTHGNSENLETLWEHVADIANCLSAAVFAFEYPGYYQGSVASERACYAACESFAKELKAIAPLPVVLMGYSMGCALALHAAEVHKGEDFPQAVVLMCPFYSVAATQLGMALSWLAAPVDRFRLRHSALVQGHPIIIFTAEDDAVTPPSHGEALFSLAKRHSPQAVHVTVPKATHGDLRIHKVVWDETKSFLDSLE